MSKARTPRWRQRKAPGVTRDGIFVNQLSPHEREALIRPTMVYVSWRCVWCFALR